MSRNTKSVPFFRPYIRRSEIRAVKRIMRSGWLTTGPEVQSFESEFASFLDSGSPESLDPIITIAVNSATSGLHLALEAAGIGPGDRVAVPSLTFTSTAEIVCYLGAEPVFIDSDPTTGNMSPEALKSAIDRSQENGREIKAVIAVHLAGLPCDMEEISRAMGISGAILIEDAAHAFPSRTPGGMAGTLADIGVYSFYATKTITTGEGGMIATRNGTYAERMRVMRLHGIDRSIWNRYSSTTGSRSWEYDVIAPGFKYNLTDLAAAIGRVQLRRADRLLAMRASIAARYDRGFSGIRGIMVPPDGIGHAWHLYILRFTDPNMRETVSRLLSDSGIGYSVHFIPLHRMSYWKDRYQLRSEDFPVAESMADRILSLPLWPGLPRREVERIIRIIREAADG